MLTMKFVVPFPYQSILNMALFCLCNISDLFPVSSLVPFPLCPSTSLMFLLSFPSCPSTSLLFHSISSRILFNSFLAVLGILIVIVKIKSRVWSPVMDTNTWRLPVQRGSSLLLLFKSELRYFELLIVRTNQSCFQFWILLCTAVVRNSSFNSQTKPCVSNTLDLLRNC